MSEPRRRYSSALHDSQAQATRDLILDALTDLLTDHLVADISTREIAERAGVSQPTVYRHFPDRQALLDGLADRIDAFSTAGVASPLASLDDIAAYAVRGLALTDDARVAATAEAVLNADPRRLSRSSRERSAELQRLVADAFPDLDARDHLRITALFRNLYSVQVWLRMREEFGIPGSESGPILAWAFETLIEEIRAGNFPKADPGE